MTHLRSAIYRAHQLLTAALEDDLAKAEVPVTAQQVTVLLAIQARDLPSQTNIVDATGIDRSTMADIVKRLCNKGLVVRKRDRADARRYCLALTSKGAEMAVRAGVLSSRIESRMATSCPSALKGLDSKLRSLVSTLETFAAPQVPAE